MVRDVRQFPDPRRAERGSSPKAAKPGPPRPKAARNSPIRRRSDTIPVPGGLRPGERMRLRLPILALSLAFVALAPTPAFAAGGGGDASETLNVVLLLMGVGAAYLLAHFVVDRLQQRFLVLAGVEYLILGLLLGPTVPDIQVLGDLTGLLPIIALTAGWLGLLRGMELDLPSLRGRPKGTLRIIGAHHVAPGLLVGFAVYHFLWSPWGGYFFGELGVEALTQRQVAASAFFLGCCAACDSSTPFDLLVRRYEIEGDLTERLRGCARLGDVLVIIVFGLVFALWHQRHEDQIVLTATEWFVLEAGLGVGLGVLFTPFLGGNESSHGRFLAMVGIICFASGAAFFLDLSPLAVNVFLGVLLVNVARTGKLIYETLTTTEKPMLLVLYVLAGALWEPPPLEPTLIVLVGFVVLRTLGKWFGSKIAAWGVEDMRKDLYRAFFAHGEVTVAMAVSFKVVFSGPVVNLVYTVVLASAVFHDLLAPRILRGLLVDAGDLKRERAQAPSAREFEEGEEVRA